MTAAVQAAASPLIASTTALYAKGIARVMALPARTSTTASTTRMRKPASSFGQSIGRKRHRTEKPPLGFSNSGAALLIEGSLRKPSPCPQRMRRTVWSNEHFQAVITDVLHGEFIMGPGFYVIAILGCADGTAGCTPVA